METLGLALSVAIFGGLASVLRLGLEPFVTREESDEKCTENVHDPKRNQSRVDF